MILNLLILACLVINNEASRILAMVPTPSLSHQVVFRPLIMELVKRGHEVVLITADPAFKKGESPANLTEIDVHDVSYEIWRKGFTKTKVTSGNKDDTREQMKVIRTMLSDVYETQLLEDKVQNILRDKSQKFDLLILEAYYPGLLGISHLVKAPVIQMSSLGPTVQNLRNAGASIHPLLYPIYWRQKLTNLTFWEKLSELYLEYSMDKIVDTFDKSSHERFRKIFGADIPPLEELRNNVDMVFVNLHQVWDTNRPVPPNVIYVGGLHQKHDKELPQDIKTYLDSSQHGVIYISFGTNVEPALLSPEKIQAIINVVSKLPYDVLWKWNQDELPGRTPNIRISKWLPQSDLLRHPKVKLFITQGGLQSTDEAIKAGVPMIGMPMLADQWYNVEQYVLHKIGLRIDFSTLSEDKLRDAIEAITNDDTYRQNVILLRNRMYDQPQTPLERAVWWTEYVMRHSGARHLRAPAANMPWHQYYELELVAYAILGILTVISSISVACYYVYKHIFGQYITYNKNKID